MAIEELENEVLEKVRRYLTMGLDNINELNTNTERTSFRIDGTLGTDERTKVVRMPIDAHSVAIWLAEKENITLYELIMEALEDKVNALTPTEIEQVEEAIIKARARRVVKRAKRRG